MDEQVRVEAARLRQMLERRAGEPMPPVVLDPDAAAVLVSRVMREFPHATIVRAEPVLEGTAILPTLAPEVRQIGETLWMHHAPEVRAKNLYYARLDDLFDWLQGSSFDELELGVLEGGEHLDFFNRFPEALAKLTDPHEVHAGEGAARYVLGFLAGQRVLLSEAPDGSCGVVTSGDLGQVNAFLEDLSMSRDWGIRKHEQVPAEAFPTDGPRPDADAFDRAVRRLGVLARLFGAAEEVAIPSDLPARPMRVLEAVNGTVGAVRVRSLPESEETLSAELRQWFANRSATGWMGRAASAAEARALLPVRARVVFVSGDGRRPAMLVTDEDTGADDPVVISLSPEEERIVIASTRLSATLAGTSVRRIRVTAGTAASQAPYEGPSPDPIAPLVRSVYELAPGVLHSPGWAWFATVDAYLAYLESLPPTSLGLFAPPVSAIARKSRTSAAVTPDGLAEQGFATFDIRTYYGYRRRGAFGRVDGIPVWISQLTVTTTPRAPVVYCLPADERKVSRWLKQRGKGSSRLPDWQREWL